jgi:hypothetical protein
MKINGRCASTVNDPQRAIVNHLGVYRLRREGEHRGGFVFRGVAVEDVGDTLDLGEVPELVRIWPRINELAYEVQVRATFANADHPTTIQGIAP